MRALVFLLVLANVLFFAFTQGYFGRPDHPDAGRLAQQLNAEQIRVVSRGEAPGKAEKESQGETAKPAEDKTAEKPLENTPEKSPEKAPGSVVCMVWGSLSGKDADRLGLLLQEKFSEFKQSRHPVVSEGGSWWVYIPALPNKAEADKKAGQLKALGVTDYFVVQDAGPNRFAISLGIFSAESGANERLAELKGKGVRSAIVGPRAGKDSQFVIEAQGPANREAAVLEAVSGTLPELRAKPCS